MADEPPEKKQKTGRVKSASLEQRLKQTAHESMRLHEEIENCDDFIKELVVLKCKLLDAQDKVQEARQAVKDAVQHIQDRKMDFYREFSMVTACRAKDLPVERDNDGNAYYPEGDNIDLDYDYERYLAE